MRLVFIPLLFGALPSLALKASQPKKLTPIFVPKGPGITPVKDSYIVMLKDDHNLDDHYANTNFNVSEVSSTFSYFKNLNGYRAVIKDPDVIEGLRRDPGVQIIEQNTYHKADKIESKPIKSPLGKKDPSLFRRNWQWVARPQVVNWKMASGAKREDEMRTMQYGGYNVNVYVVDSGVNPTNQIDQQRLWWLKTEDPRAPSPYCWNGEEALDQTGHGTGCATIIGGNDIGVAPGVDIISVKNLCAGYSLLDLAHQAMEDIWAREVDLAAREGGSTGAIINFSQAGSMTNSQAFQESLTRFKRGGIFIIAAGGNSNVQIDDTWVPQSYDDIYVVGNVGQNGRKHPSSNYGRAIDIWAPGEAVETLNHLGQWVTMTGTSFSAPWVVGLAALIWSYEAAVIGRDVDKIWERIKQNAKRDGVKGVPQGTTKLLFRTGANHRHRHPSHPYAYVSARTGGSGDVEMTDADADGMDDIL